jgi:hypothetical protein
MPSPVIAKKGPYDWAFVCLDYACEEKAEQLRRFCERIHALARQAAGDPSLIGFFDINRQYVDALAKGPVPERLTAKIDELREELNRYYIDHYFSFYDILFVDSNGNIFYTIRKELNLHKDLFHPTHTGSALARCLAENPSREAFVDFDQYGPSCKPAAFFVEPVHSGKAIIGWLVFQCAINKVNTIFSGTEELGRTGETLLVNKNGLMLTESNFIGDSTTLKKRLDDRNLQIKFENRKGNRIVTDYRGYSALTSFKVVEFLGTHWLVVAKVDEDEILTEYYTRHRRYYADRLLDDLQTSRPPPLHSAPILEAENTLRIDMDEFIRANDGERLQTYGISTCTGFIAAFPGRFGYMAHISSVDKVYGASGSNLLGQIIKKVKSFDVYPCEHRAMVFTVVVTHLNSLLAIIDKLVGEGFFLSQIQVLYYPEAISASVSYDYAQQHLHVFWRLKSLSDAPRVQLQADTRNIGQLIRGIVESEEGRVEQE